MKQILGKLFEHKKLSKAEAKDILVNISSGKYNEAQIASFITVYLMRPISVDELQGFREALLELCIPVDLEGVEAIDVCGTGGDGKNTFNISTLSAFILAGAGYKVAKHGNVGVSSNSGSSDVLQYLGYQFTNDTDKLKRQLDKANICYFHAPFFHPALKTVGPIRKQLSVKTFFNMLGPLVNPAQPKYQLSGVFSLELARLYQYIFQQIPNKQFAIVHALDGYDEVSLTGDFKVKMNHFEATLSPLSIGKKQLTQESLFGGDTVEEAGTIFMSILRGQGTQAQVDAVTANAGIAIHCIKPQTSLIDCIAEADEALKSGQALSALERLIQLN
ncbi:MAG: anthranilate phosphoribosyltransferase [Saprospiraceae bacterium]|nr:anthranilate phosphoribosyltransferase [Saprospiraceae bacterium]